MHKFFVRFDKFTHEKQKEQPVQKIEIPQKSDKEKLQEFLYSKQQRKTKSR